MTVDRLRQQMPSEEFVYWNMYYARLAQRRELEAMKAKTGGRR